MRRVARDATFWGAVMVTGVVGVALFKILVARLPVPDGLNELAAGI